VAFVATAARLIRGRGGRSPLQSKASGSTTTDLGMNGAESAWLKSRSAASLCQRYPYTASSHSTPPSMALAYGSMSSLAGLHLTPLSGSYGPWTRYP